MPSGVSSIAAVTLLLATAIAEAQPLTLPDRQGDAVIRRTDPGGDGAIDPATQRIPDVLSLRVGQFAPFQPHVDRFQGAWLADGLFMRLDLVLRGLVNPPGPLAYDDVSPVYDPLRYGPHPLFGFIELDVDADPQTGGELGNPQLRFLGNVARFGGRPTEPRFAGRVAVDYTAFDGDVASAPFVERSGEEFHVAFLGESIDLIDVKYEKLGGDPTVFEEGEIWQVRGRWLHRAHGFEAFAFSCVARPGPYKPLVRMQFAHDAVTDQTLVSLVYPLTNEGSAALIDPNQPIESDNGCDDDQNSVEEALLDLWFSATWADPFNRLLPEFELIAGWEFNAVGAHLDPTAWAFTALVGSAYASQQTHGARFIWTDTLPGPDLGDFNGDGARDALDVQLLDAYVAAHDGDPLYDDDGSATNGSLDLHDFAINFSLFDTDYGGIIDADDAVLLGDMDLDRVVDIDDVDDFVQALLDPQGYTASHNGADPLARGDLNADGRLDGLDAALLLPRMSTADNPPNS